MCSVVCDEKRFSGPHLMALGWLLRLASQLYCMALNLCALSRVVYISVLDMESAWRREGGRAGAGNGRFFRVSSLSRLTVLSVDHSVGGGSNSHSKQAWSLTYRANQVCV